MLAAATRHLASRHETTLVVARHARRFCATCEGTHALEADWNAADFQARLAEALDHLPSPRTALLWLHRLESDLAFLLPRLSDARVVLVLGSMDGQPALPSFQGIVTVQLGSLATANGRRWLTNDEIAAAAIASLEEGTSRIVGELKPLR